MHEKDPFTNKNNPEYDSAPDSPENQEMANEAQKGLAVESVSSLVNYAINENPRSEKTAQTPEGIMHTASASVGNGGEARIYDNGTSITRFELIDRNLETNEECQITILNPGTNPEILINGEREVRADQMQKIQELVAMMKQEEEAAKKAKEEVGIKSEQIDGADSETEAGQVTDQAEVEQFANNTETNLASGETLIGQPELNQAGVTKAEPPVRVGVPASNVVDFQARRNQSNTRRRPAPRTVDQALVGSARRAA